MGKPERGTYRQQAEALRLSIARSYVRCQQALAALASPVAEPQESACSPLEPPPCQRQYALCLAALEVTVYGYCIERQFGWERRTEAAFMLRRPALWRRLLRPAPLLAFTITASGAATVIRVAGAQRSGYRGRNNCIMRLDLPLQQHLKQVHEHQVAISPFQSALSKWRSFFK